MRASTLLSLAGIVVAVLAWHAVVALGWISGYIVPPPLEVWLAGVKLVGDGSLLPAFLLTLGLTLAAIAIAGAVGIVCGWLLYRHRILGLAYETWLGALFSAPLILFYPIFMVVFGRNPSAIVAMGAMASLVPVILKTREGLLGVRPVLLSVARSFNASESQVTRKVLIPAALPTLFTGLRLGLIYAMINVVAMEYLANFGGLGFLVGELYDRFDIPGMYAAALFVIVMSVIVFWGAERLEAWFQKV
ncbi:MAG: ABC transporter permease subunit [Variovorax sp.]